MAHVRPGLKRPGKGISARDAVATTPRRGADRAAQCYLGEVTYNFDPDRWYERERLRLELEHSSARLSDDELEAALADLDERYQEMLDRLDGSFEIPSTT